MSNELSGKSKQLFQYLQTTRQAGCSWGEVDETVSQHFTDFDVAALLAHHRVDSLVALYVEMGEVPAAPRERGQEIVVVPICTSEDWKYRITINVDTVAQTSDLWEKQRGKRREKLQACVYAGIIYDFWTHTDTHEDRQEITLIRHFDNDFEALKARLNKGELLHVAAKNKLADDLESNRHGPDGLTAIIKALRDEKNGVVEGLAEHRKLQVSTDLSEEQWQGLAEAELVRRIEDAGFSVSGPSDSRAVENGEPVWVCNARAALAAILGAARKTPTYQYENLSVDQLGEICRNALRRGELWRPDVRVKQQSEGYVWFDIKDGT